MTDKQNTALPDGSVLHALDRYSFSDEAAQVVKGACNEIEIVYHSDISDLGKTVDRREGYGLLPFENSSSPDSLVGQHMNLLLENEWRIVGEVNLRVRMCVGATALISEDQILSVRSHPKGLEQSHLYLSSLPNLKKQNPAPSTAEAARILARDKEKSLFLPSVPVR